MADGGMQCLEDMRARELRLVCPGCGTSLSRLGTACACGVRLEIADGLARVLEPGQQPEAPDAAGMSSLLDLMATMPWRDALRSSPGHQELLRRLTARIGEDVLYGLLWTRIERVLVIGAGWGELAFAIAAHGPEVVALEPSVERARFIQLRAAQDGGRVRAVVADPLRLPFEAASFDLVALAVDPAAVGRWGKGDAGQLLAGLLADGRRLLRTGGSIYLAGRSRFGLSAWLGRRDRSGLRFAQVMPRRLAGLYARALGKRQAAALSGDDIRSALLRAGFATVEMQGIVGQRCEQRGAYDVTDADARRGVRSRLTRPVSVKSRIKNGIAASRLLGARLEDHVALVAGVDASAGRRLWADVGEGEPAGQIDTYSKVMLMCRHASGVRSILETAKTQAVERRLASAYAVLERAEAVLGQQNAQAEVRWVQPLGRLRRDGRDWYRYELATGPTLTSLVLCRRRHGQVVDLFERALRGYLMLCGRLASAGPQDARGRPHAELLNILSETWWDRGLVSRVREAMAFAERAGWGSAPMQGDLSGDNLVLTGKGRLCLIDWETVEASGYPEIDITRLYYDLAMELLDAGVPWGREMIGDLRKALLSVLHGSGRSVADLEPIETLYFGHQAATLGDKARAVGSTGMRLDRLERLLADERVSIRCG